MLDRAAAPGQARVLAALRAALGAAEGPMPSLTALAKSLGTSRQWVRLALDALEAKGEIARCMTETQIVTIRTSRRRAVVVRLTAAPVEERAA